MPEPKPIRIAGGGVAGLSLGISLRLRQVPVTVVEPRRYPRHRVCGEFISGHGQEVLEDLGLTGPLLDAGARWGHRAAFYPPASPLIQSVLPQPALCVSRYILDHLLARELVRLGGEIRFDARCSPGEAREGTVRATGRRVQPSVHGWRWFGLKVHARGVPLQADLEMHLVPGGYVGLCQLDKEVNVCGLFRTRSPQPDLGRKWRDLLQGPAGSDLRSRLGRSSFDDDSFCSVGGVCITGQMAGGPDECCIGDALTMMPPLMGNGMSLALESSALAAEPLERYSRGGVSWETVCRQIASACRQRFESRLRSALWLHQLLFLPGGSWTAARFLRRFPGLLEALFKKTR